MPSKVPLSSWMAHVANPNVLVSHLSIPGTHDSCSKSVVPFVGTQSLTISEQAEQGIRFFDLRINLTAKKNPVLVHGDYPLGLNLVDVLQSLYDFLDNHPKEGLVIQFKRDGSLPAKWTPFDFSNVIFSVIASNPSRWRLETDIPKLSDLQGRVQLVRRFELFPPQALNSAGLDVQKWEDNWDIPFDITATPGSSVPNVRVQDKYDFAYARGGPWKTIPIKFDLVKSLMQEAASNQKRDVWYFNYTSAVTFTLAEPWEFAQGFYDDDRSKYCKGVNTYMQEFLTAQVQPVARYGVLMMDYPTDSRSTNLVRAIIESNDLIP